jgi:hypothetical protein
MLILLAAILIVGVLLLIRWFTQADPQAVRGLFKIIVVLAAMAAIVILILTGRIYALMTGVIALAPLSPFFIRFFKSGAAAEMGDKSKATYSNYMSTDEAYRILGLEKGASSEEIKKAHKALIRKIHPDQGGSDYLTQKVNQARDLLLGNSK